MGSLCPLPWLHISADYNEELRLCCNAGHEREIRNDQGKVIKLSDVDDFRSFLNNPSYVSVRKEMLAGKFPKACANCQKIECNGGASPRLHHLNHYAEVFEELLHQTDDEGVIHSEMNGPRFFDMSLGNRCNLRCRMCSPVFSASLLPIFEKIGFEDQYDRDKVKSVPERWAFDEQQEQTIKKWAPSMDKVMIQGGEPFLTPQVWTFLKWLIEAGVADSIYLKIATNLTVMPIDKLNILTEFKGVHFHVSLEGTKPFNDYIRQGSIWEQTVGNLEKLVKMKKVYPFSFNINTVLQAYNLADTVNFISWCEKKWGLWPTFGLLYFPDYLSAKILPQLYKERIGTKIKDFVDSHIGDLEGKDLVNAQTLKSHLDYISAPVAHRNFFWERFCIYTDGLDQHFHTKWSDLVGDIYE